MISYFHAHIHTQTHTIAAKHPVLSSLLLFYSSSTINFIINYFNFKMTIKLNSHAKTTLVDIKKEEIVTEKLSYNLYDWSYNNNNALYFIILYIHTQIHTHTQR